MALSRYRDQVELWLEQAPVEVGVGTPAIEERVRDAVADYSRLRPRYLVHEYTGDGTTDAFALPTEWDIAFSKIRALEYPLEGRPPNSVDPRKYCTYFDGTDWKIVTNFAPGSGDGMRLHFIAPHVVDETTDTVPEADFRAVCFLAAAYTARNLAGKYGGFSDDILAADVFNYRTKRAEFEAVANTFEAMFKQHFGMKPGDLAPAAAERGDMDLASEATVVGVKPITHSR